MFIGMLKHLSTCAPVDSCEHAQQWRVSPDDQGQSIDREGHDRALLGSTRILRMLLNGIDAPAY
jgi:hypothetical protein